MAHKIWYLSEQITKHVYVIGIKFCQNSFASTGHSLTSPMPLGSGRGWDLHDLTHWGGVTHICVSRLTTVGSDNGLSPGQCQAVIWTNAGILIIWPLGTNFSEILIKIHMFYSRNCIWKFGLLNVGHLVSASMCQCTIIMYPFQGWF